MGTTAEKLVYLAETKAAIKSAIEGLGISVGDAPFREYANIIGERLQPSEAFVTTWDMPVGNISIPSQDDTYNCVVDWGDGTTSVHTTGPLTHTYDFAGIRKIKISGQYNGFKINNNATVKNRLLSIDNWGEVGFTSFQQAFHGCTNLSSIPFGAITGAEAVTSFANCFFKCQSLTEIPSGLFNNCTAVTNFSFCFSDCQSLTAIPSGLFDKCTAATNFSYCFNNCQSLTSIPSGLFDKCTEVALFNSCFNNCQSLASIPSGLFDKCTAVTNFTSCFNFCKSLTSIPSGLFDKCTAVSNFSYCFNNCQSLTEIPSGLFDNCTAATNFYYCFHDCAALTGAAPTLWISHASAEGTGCYTNCTGLSNYAEIPDAWK